MSYTENERNKVLEQSKKFDNKLIGVNLAFAYNLYDIMRLQLEELHRIGNAMESIYKIINQEQQNQ